MAASCVANWGVLIRSVLLINHPTQMPAQRPVCIVKQNFSVETGNPLHEQNPPMNRKKAVTQEYFR